MSKLAGLLEELAEEANADLSGRSVTQPEIAEQIEWVCRCIGNRAGVRLLMACMLGKIDDPRRDPREPYTEIGSNTCFSGRGYDEEYVTAFVTRHKLPCNNTTAFLTPALRNLDRPLDGEAVGRPKRMYSDSFAVLSEVANGQVAAKDVLRDIIRWLLVMRNEQQERMQSLLEGIKHSEDVLPPSSEAIVNLLRQHLACKNASRLPVLGVAAAYNAVSAAIGERTLPLKVHTAADLQTGAIGDIEICLANDERIVTVYEMKKKRVTTNDIDHAVTKIATSRTRLDNYVFITSDMIAEDVAAYAEAMYDALNGTEIVVLDYIGFVRHYLHFFHRFREAFLDSYQELVLSEPASAVPQSLKEAFLALRNALIVDEEVADEQE